MQLASYCKTTVERTNTIYKMTILPCRMILELVIILDAIVFVTCGCTFSHDHQHVSCRNMDLLEVPKRLPKKMRRLDLSENLIRELLTDNFARYSELEELIINDNKLVRIYPKAFQGLKRLNSLSLRGNKLNISHAYPNTVFKPLTSLEKLDITRNSDKDIFDKNEKYNLPTDDLTKLRELSIDLIPQPDFGEQFEMLQALQIVKFDYCQARVLNGTFKHFPKNLKEFHLTTCKYFVKVDPGLLEPFPNLSVLNLTHSNIQLESALGMLRPFQNKTMDGIYFRGVTGPIGIFKMLNTVTLTSKNMYFFNHICVRTFDISDNNIVSVENNAFGLSEYPQCFENLLCAGNRFGMDGWAVQFSVFLSKMRNLKLLDFSYLPLEFPDPVFLNVYRDRNNKWVYEKTQNHYKMSNVDVVINLPGKVQYARLTHLMAVGGFREFKFINSSLEHLEVSYFDSPIFSYLTFLGSNKMRHLDLSGIDSTITVGQGKISHLKHLKTLVLQNVKLYHVVKTNDTIFHWCPNIHNLDISYNYMWFLKLESVGPLRQLRSLNLSHNMFDVVPEVITTFPNLRELDLSYNELTSIPVRLLKWIDGQEQKLGSFRLYLDKNPFVCSCETEDFVEWLGNTNVTRDNDGNYSCWIPKPTNKKGYTIDVSNNMNEFFIQCDSKTWLKTGICLLAAICCFLIIITFLYNLRWRIVYGFERILRKLGEGVLGIKLPYEVYISYLHENDRCRKYAKSVLCKLEWYGFKSYFRGRDSIPGGDEYLQISDAISKSRNFIFFDMPIVNEADVKKRQYEIRKATHEYVENNLRKFIIITENVDLASTKIIHEWFSAVLKKDIKLIQWPLREENVDDFYHHLRLQLTFPY